MTQTREKFLASRRAFLGGTDIAAIAGKHKYKTPLAVYADKALEIDPDSDDERLIAEMGIVLEPLVKRVFGKAMGFPVLDHPTVKHQQYPFLGGNPDGMFSPDSLVEIKTHGFATHDEWGEEMTDEVPDAYHVQATWYCGLTGAERCYFAAFDRDKARLRAYVVEANPEYFEALVSLGVSFWRNHVEKKIEPKASEAGDLPVVRAIYSKPPIDLVVATDEMDDTAAKYCELQKLVKAGEKSVDALKAQLIQAIGNASGIQTASGTFTYKARKDGVRVLRAPAVAA